MGRPWVAGFDRGALVLKRRRFLPWPKRELKKFPLEAIVDIQPAAAADWARGKARVTARNPAAPPLIEVIEVEFAAQHRHGAADLIRRLASSSVPKDAGPKAAPSSASAPADTQTLASPPTRLKYSAKPSRIRRLPTISEVVADPSAPTIRRSAIAPIRADDGKRQVWLWRQDGKIHASLAPVGEASCHKLDPAELALLLLADPQAAMPAIHALTGIDDSRQALARVHSWRSSGNAVALRASDLSGRKSPGAIRRPAGQNADGSVRTVSGGLPSLGKRRK